VIINVDNFFLIPKYHKKLYVTLMFSLKGNNNIGARE